LNALLHTHRGSNTGRLIDLIQRKVINLKETKFLVLDEADEMVTILKESLDEIIAELPAHKTLLFSANAGNHKAINPKLPE
jgi:superfamily II DNA/RNA helicase